MPEDVTKRISVTFGTGLPHGTHAHFKHNDEMWIAYPASKNTEILSVTDKMLGIFRRISRDMTRWLNEWPEDTAKVIQIMAHINRAQIIANEIISEKQRAQTQ